jgi:hypothetical protein
MTIEQILITNLYAAVNDLIEVECRFAVKRKEPIIVTIHLLPLRSSYKISANCFILPRN